MVADLDVPTPDAASLSHAFIGVGLVVYGSPEAIKHVVLMQQQLENMQRTLRKMRDLSEELVKEYRASRV